MAGVDAALALSEFRLLLRGLGSSRSRIERVRPSRGKVLVLPFLTEMASDSVGNEASDREAGSRSCGPPAVRGGTG